MGRGKKNLQAIQEKSLANWRQQLENDRKLDGASLRLALDYREIGSLLTKLGRRQEAIEEYRQGMVIMEISAQGSSGHPRVLQHLSRPAFEQARLPKKNCASRPKSRPLPQL